MGTTEAAKEPVLTVIALVQTTVVQARGGETWVRRGPGEEGSAFSLSELGREWRGGGEAHEHKRHMPRASFPPK